MNFTAFLKTASNRAALSIDDILELVGNTPAGIGGDGDEEKVFPEVGVGVLLPSKTGDRGLTIAAEGSRLLDALMEAVAALPDASAGGEVGME
jgi:hypothetical protein